MSDRLILGALIGAFIVNGFVTWYVIGRWENKLRDVAKMIAEIKEMVRVLKVEDGLLKPKEAPKSG